MKSEPLDPLWQSLRTRLHADLCARGLPPCRIETLLNRLGQFYHKYGNDEFDLTLPCSMTAGQIDALKESLRDNMSRLMSKVMLDFVEVEAHRMYLEIELEELAKEKNIDA